MALTVPVAEIVERSSNPLLGKAESWGRVLLGDIATIQNGFAFKSSQFSKDAGMPLIRIRDVGKDTTDTRYVGEYDPAYVVNAGDLLVGMDGDFNCARWHGEPGLLNQRVCRIILTSDIYHPKLLDYALPGYLKAINEMTSSVTVKHLSSKSIAQIPLPLPPMEQQKRIVAEIEKQFSRLDEAVANLKRVKANLKRHKAAVLKAAVEGKLTEEWRKAHPDVEPASKLLDRILAERRAKWEEAELAKMEAKGKAPKNDKWKAKYKEPKAFRAVIPLPNLPETWQWVGVDQIGASGEQAVLTGPFGSNLGKGDFTTEGVPVLTIGCLQETGVTLDKAMYVHADKAEELGRYRLTEGDLLFSRMASVGRAGYVERQLSGALFNYHIMRLRLSKDAIDPSYFISYVRGSGEVRDYVREVNHGATRDGINTEQLMEMPVALPPREEQQKIMTLVDERLTVIYAIEKQVDENMARADRLRQSILERAFSGLLVPEDPSAEPASDLLKRIREHVELKHTKRIRKTRTTKPAGKESAVTNLLEALQNTDEWVNAQEVFRRCGVGAGADTDAIERIYADLRGYVRSGFIEVERRDEEDWLRASQQQGG